MDFIEPRITKVAAGSGFAEACRVEWDRQFIDKWQYHQLGLVEHLEICRGALTIEFSKAYGLKDIIRPAGDSGVTPNLLVHRLRSSDAVTLTCSFKDKWFQEQEPLFKNENDAWLSLNKYLSDRLLTQELRFASYVDNI